MVVVPDERLQEEGDDEQLRRQGEYGLRRGEGATIGGGGSKGRGGVVAVTWTEGRQGRREEATTGGGGSNGRSGKGTRTRTEGRQGRRGEGAITQAEGRYQQKDRNRCRDRTTASSAGFWVLQWGGWRDSGRRGDCRARGGSPGKGLVHRLPKMHAPLIRAGGTGGQNLTRNQDKERAGEAEGASTLCTHRGGPPRRGGDGIGLQRGWEAA